MGCGGSKDEAQPPQQNGGNQPAQRAPAQQAASGNTQLDQDLEQELKVNFDRKDARPEDNQAMVGMFEMEAVGAGDQIGANKPWLGAIVAPSNPPPCRNAAPGVNYDLEYCYGYRCFDSRQNLFYVNANNVVYMTAAIGVVLDKNANTQRFFGAGHVRQANGHSDDITALAISNDRRLVVTGEVGANPKVCIWDPSNPESGPRKDFKLGRGRRGVTALSFFGDASHVVAVDLHNDHYVSVWNASSGAKVGEDKGGPDKVLDVACSPQGTNFVTVGVKHIYFWEFNNGLSKNRGISGGNAQLAGETFTSVQYLDANQVVAGGANGELFLFQGNTAQKKVKCNQGNGGIHTLRVVDGKVYAGGQDGKVHVFDLQLNETSSIEVGSCPRAIDVLGGNVLVGSRDGTIAEFQGSNRRVLMESHADGEVWGLAIDPMSPNQIVTTGDDNKIRVWDINQRKCVSSGTLDPQKGQERRAGQGASTLAHTTPNQQARGVAINSNGDVAVGHNDGKVTIRSVRSLDNIRHTLREPKEWIQAMSYSPDGSKLAVGSHDNAVYIYSTSDYKLLGKCNKHSSFITGLDWSQDGQNLHTVSGDYELLFWDVGQSIGTQLTDGATRLRDEEWATWSVILGWPVRGIFGGIIDYTHINSVDRSYDKTLVATGNDWGLVEIFGFPNEEGAKSDAFRAHSEHVTNVKMSANNSRVFSAGGYDQTICQWRQRQ